jgi:hypothetical protein
MYIYLLLFWRDEHMYLLEFWDARIAHAWRNHYMFEGCWTLLLNANLNFALPPAPHPAPRLALNNTAPVSAVRPVDEDGPILTVLHGLST